MAAGALALGPPQSQASSKQAAPARKKQGAVVRAAFIYPPSKTFADDPDGWWSWPGNHFDAEARQKQYNGQVGDRDSFFPTWLEHKVMPFLAWASSFSHRTGRQVIFLS